MTVKQIQEILKGHGIDLSAPRIEEQLKAYELKAEELTPEMVTGWAEELKQAENRPTKGKGGGLAKAKNEAIAPTQQEAIAAAPHPQQQPVDFNIQPLTSTIHNTIEQMVTLHRQNEIAAIRAAVGFYEKTSDRIISGVAQELATRNISASIDAVLEQQQAAWDAAHLKIEELINNATTA